MHEMTTPGGAGPGGRPWPLLAMALLPLLAGCFDLDRFEDPEDADFDSALPATWLFHYDPERLRAIAPGAALEPRTVGDSPPQSPLAVDGGAPPVGLVGGEWGPGIERARVERVVYADIHGRLFQVATDLERRPEDTRRRLSSQGGTRICGWMPAPDFADPDAAAVAFLVEDGSGCDPEIAGAGNWKAARIGADRDTAPEDFPGEPLRALVDDEGRFAGYLAHQPAERRILRVRPDLRSWEVLRSGVDRVEELAGMPGRAAALVVDGELCVQPPAADAIDCRDYRFDDADGRPSEYVLDGEVLYFVDGGALWRAELTEDGADSVARIAAPSDAGVTGADALQRLTLTPDHLAWLYPERDGAARLRSYQRRAAADDYRLVYSIAIGDAPARINPRLPRRSGGWVFYSRIADDGRPQAVARRADDASRMVRFADAWWASGSGNPLAADPAAGFEIAKLIEGAEDGPGGASLRTVSAAEPDGPSVRPGAFGSGVQELEFPRGAHGVDRLVTARVDGRDRVYYFDSTRARSLVRLPGDEPRRPVVAFPAGMD